MSYYKFTKNLGMLGITQAALALNGIILLPVITKFLGARNYGTWTQLMVTIGILAPIAMMGLPYTLVRFLAGEKNKKEIQDGVWSVFSIIFSISVVFSLLLFYFSRPIGAFFSCDPLLIQILALVVIFEFLNMLFSNIFRAFQQIKEYCYFTLFQAFGETVLVIMAVLGGYGLMGAVIAFLIIRVINFCIMSYFIVKRVGIAMPHFSNLRQYLKFGLPNILGDISSWITQSSDRYLIGFFLGTLFVGYYAPAYTLGGAISFLTAPLTFILPATLSSHYDNQEVDEVKIYLKNSLKYFLMIAIPACFGLSILSKQLLTIFSTAEIASHASSVVPLVALSMVLCGTYIIFDQVISLKKKTYINSIIWLFAALVNLALNLVFIPIAGITGAAATTLVSYAFAFVLTWHYSFKELKFDIDWKFIIKSILVSVAMSLLILAFNPTGLIKTLLAVIFGASFYFVAIFLLKGFGKAEVNFLKNIYQN